MQLGYSGKWLLRDISARPFVENDVFHLGIDVTMQLVSKYKHLDLCLGIFRDLFFVRMLNIAWVVSDNYVGPPPNSKVPHTKPPRITSPVALVLVRGWGCPWRAPLLGWG